jgi:hypothetical protein
MRCRVDSVAQSSRKTSRSKSSIALAATFLDGLHSRSLKRGLRLIYGVSPQPGAPASVQGHAPPRGYATVSISLRSMPHPSAELVEQGVCVAYISGSPLMPMPWFGSRLAGKLLLFPSLRTQVLP